MDFPLDDEIFTGITWRSMVFFLVSSIAVACCTVLLSSVVLRCSPFLGFGWFSAGCFSRSQVWLPRSVSPMSLRGLWRNLWCHLSLLLHGQNFWDSHLSLRCPGLIQTWHNLWHFTISQRVCRSLFWNWRHEASSYEPEQQKQLCTPRKDESASLVFYTSYWVSQSCSLHILLQSTMYCKYSLKLKGYTKIGCATPDTKNH